MNDVLIFDVDGCLNRHGQTMQGHWAEPDCVAQFNRVVDETGCRLVCCSAWRYLVHHGYMSLQGFQTLLRTHGIHGELIDVTRPSYDEQNRGQWGGNEGSEPRYLQIADWLKRNGDKYERYAICDDNPEAFGGRPGVRPAPDVGITEINADQLISILKGN
jgi:hypothetical protein